MKKKKNQEVLFQQNAVSNLFWPVTWTRGLNKTTIFRPRLLDYFDWQGRSNRDFKIQRSDGNENVV